MLEKPTFITIDPEGNEGENIVCLFLECECCAPKERFDLLYWSDKPDDYKGFDFRMNNRGKANVIEDTEWAAAFWNEFRREHPKAVFKSEKYIKSKTINISDLPRIPGV